MDTSDPKSQYQASRKKWIAIITLHLIIGLPAGTQTTTLPQSPATSQLDENEEPRLRRGIVPVPDQTPAPAPVEDKSVPPNLSKSEIQMARRAWQYFRVTQQSSTGLFDSVFGYPHATMWDISSGLAGLVAAERLELIKREEFITQMRQVLQSLTRMPLYQHELPNREYDIRTMALLDTHSQSSSRGSGWSAIDLGRLLIWLKIIAKWYPEFQDPVRKIVDSWNFSRVLKGDELQGALFTGSKEHLRQEGRLGYEQYAATGFGLWGHHLKKPFQYSAAKQFPIYNLMLLHDTRKPAFLTSEPFVLSRMELGSIDQQFDRLEKGVYEVQRQRWAREGILTVVSEDAVSEAPWFVYNTISANGQDWVCVGVTGKPYPQLKSISTKAAVAWFAIQDDSYARQIFDAVKDLSEPSSGYYAGRFDNGATNKSRNLNTNAIVLEAILYKQLGRRAFIEVNLPVHITMPSKTQSDTRSTRHAGNN